MNDDVVRISESGEVSLESLLESRQRECSTCGGDGDEEQDGFVVEYGWWVCGGCSEAGQ